MLRIAICDDLPEQAAALSVMVEALLKKNHGDVSFEIDRYASAAALLDMIGQQPYDIVFLDIQLNGEDGIESAVHLNCLAPLAQIIFVSAYLDYVRRIYSAKHLYFLAKPIERERLSDALAQAIEKLSAQSDGRLLLKLSNSSERVFLYSEISYGERMGRVTALHLTDGETVKLHQTIREMLALLPDDQFSSPHNSFFVHLNRVRSFDRHSLHLDDGTIIPDSNMKRQAFQAALEKNLL